jgi:hypothetical protein
VAELWDVPACEVAELEETAEVAPTEEDGSGREVVPLEDTPADELVPAETPASVGSTVGAGHAQSARSRPHGRTRETVTPTSMSDMDSTLRETRDSVQLLE